MTFEKVATLMAGTRGRQAEREGDADAGTWAAGQGIGLIGEVKTCQDVMNELIQDAEQTITEQLASMMTPKL